jgi:hypothetical protein
MRSENHDALVDHSWIGSAASLPSYSRVFGPFWEGFGGKAVTHGLERGQTGIGMLRCGERSYDASEECWALAGGQMSIR